MSANGFIHNLKILDKRETPTEIIIDYNNYYVSNKDRLAHLQRLTGMGYDMACRILYRLWTLLNDNTTYNNIASVWLILKDIIFVDKFHIKGHTTETCVGDGILNPYNDKWAKILINANTNVVEQMWSQFNKYRFLKVSSRYKLEVFIELYKRYQNDIVHKQLLKDGYKFIPITMIDINYKFNNNINDNYNNNESPFNMKEHIKNNENFEIKTPTIKNEFMNYVQTLF